MQGMTQQQVSVEENTHSGGATQEHAKVIILLGLAIYFVYNILSGNLSNYINVRFQWLSIVAVVLFSVLGLATLYGLLRGHYRRDRGAYGFDHRPITWSILAIASIPLLLGVLIPSQPLGAEAVNGNISLSVADYDLSGAFTKDPATRNVLDWLRVFSASSTPSEFDGQEATFIGFVYREPDFPEDHFMVARFTVSCCVADANAIGLPVYWPGAGDIADGEWVQVSGEFVAGTFRDLKTPILQVDDLELIDQPLHPYLYT
jgi:putative membrane protein